MTSNDEVVFKKDMYLRTIVVINMLKPFSLTLYSSKQIDSNRQDTKLYRRSFQLVLTSVIVEP